MKTTIIVIATLIVLLFVNGGLTVSFKPFSIKFPTYLQYIGWVLLITGVSFISVSHGKEEYKKGRIEMMKDIEKAIDEFIAKKKKDEE